MKRTFFILSLLMPVTIRSMGQQSIWEGSKEQLEQVKENGKKKVSKLKQWKDHVAAWGLDSNYNYALSLSARLNTNGWSGGVCYTRQTAAGKKALWQLHFSELRHEKEVKQQRIDNTFSYLGKSSAYIFGKINNAYTLQLGYGREQTLLPALLDGNISLGLRYSAGPALALLKPYYLDLIYVEYQPEVAHLQTEKYNQGNADKFLQPGSIQGKAPWARGLGEIKYIPGAFVELAFVLEPGKPKGFIQTITIGGNAAFYTSKLEIMAERKAYNYQASFFIGLALGKRWK